MEVEERTEATPAGASGGPAANLPRIPNATVRRDALLARLHEAGERRLVLVTAAAGSGKSSLLAHWAADLDRPVAWLSCTDAHADETAFWADLGRAVAEAWAGEGILGAEVEPGPDSAPTRLNQQLRTVATRGVLVVDDFHLASVAPASMVGFIGGLPPTVQLVLSTRADPPFSLARMRVQGTLLELRQADLAFSPAETEAALATIDVALEGAEIEQLHAVTEGWPAGVHLLAISLRDHPELGVDLARLVADDRNLADFLLNEVVDRQRPEVQEFLTITAELGSFDPELVDEVTGRTDGAELLEEVRAGNLFLVEDVGTAARYRYHHLFLEFLRLRLQAEGPEAAKDVHRRAGEAHTRRGNWAEAVRHLLDADELDAARLLLGDQITQAGTVDVAGGATVARRWLAEHGETQLHGDTSGFLECTMALHVGGDVEEAELWLRRWREREPDLDHTRKVLLHGAWAFHHVFCGD
ncbi:MAG: AAA family ATPase, partial [Actinobacteria bacterium]|nr:AAA family ATPase [Actinomycetota bacterium]